MNEAYQQIKKSILYGEFYPGERLIQMDLAMRFNASRLHVRDALNRLQAEGLLETVPNKGATVKKLNPTGVEEAFGILVCLEVYGAELGLPKCTEKHIKELRNLNRRMLSNANRDNFLGYIENNIEFHTSLARIGNNKTLVALIHNLREVNSTYTVQALSITKHKEKYIKDHELIIDACAERDLEKLKSRIRNHIDYAKSVIVSYCLNFHHKRNQK